MGFVTKALHLANINGAVARLPDVHLEEEDQFNRKETDLHQSCEQSVDEFLGSAHLLK